MFAGEAEGFVAEDDTVFWGGAECEEEIVDGLADFGFLELVDFLWGEEKKRWW